ncbi:MAG: Asp-tRNA(Asn)/Glu-tRNA(Gln) amidotransferase subunit GatA [Gammaproteobacteria bacterium]
MELTTIAQHARDLTAKKYSSVELTQAYLNQIKQFNPSINALVSVTEQHALTMAQEADQRIAQGNALPLTGIPFAQKDLFCTAGIKTSCSSKMLDAFIAPYDAHVVEQCNKQGMPLLGKTNMDEFAMGSSNEHSYYGAVKNPWDVKLSPGGSSGGSAAAVAAYLTPGATGTDTGGSIRQPAALCGISGLKPTYGRVSRYGMIAYASSLDQGGPMAHTAEDLALLMNVIAGFDERDSTSVDEPVPDYTAKLTDSLQGLRIGLPKEYFAQGLDSEVEQATQAAIKQLERLGVSFQEVSLPNTHLAIPVYYVIASAEASSNLARFDGVRYGHRCDNPTSLDDLYLRSRAEGFGAEVKRRIMMGTYALSAGYYDAYYLQAQKVRRLIRDEFLQAFQQVDLLLGPTAPTPAFAIGEKINDPISMYLNDIYTVAVNLAGLPALSMPAGFNAQQRPIGLQLIGGYFAEARLLNVAHQYQLQTDWHLRQPPSIQ